MSNVAYPTSFLKAFNHAMTYEVGAFWNPEDAGVISGAISTVQQRKNVGYVNIKEDHGGLTKYGIAQNANLDLDVKNLNLEQTQAVYFTKYWLAANCDKLSPGVAAIHFDAAVNCGVGRANKFLQRAVGVKDDGQIGPVTLAALNALAPIELIKRVASARESFYNQIVANNKSQSIFLKGWLRRVNEVRDYAIALASP